MKTIHMGKIVTIIDGNCVKTIRYNELMNELKDANHIEVQYALGATKSAEKHLLNVGFVLKRAIWSANINKDDRSTPIRGVWVR